jgi:hypothetical protein
MHETTHRPESADSTRTTTEAAEGAAVSGAAMAIPGLSVATRRPKSGAAVRRTALTVRRDPTGATAVTAKSPQAATTYTLAQARAELLKMRFDAKPPLGETLPAEDDRKKIAAAWGKYILDLSDAKMGKVTDSYKAIKSDKLPGEFSVSQEIDGVPEMVVHAHMDPAGKPKTGNAVHWKWSGDDGEMRPETYELPSSQVAKLVDVPGAMSHWLTIGKPVQDVKDAATATKQAEEQKAKKEKAEALAKAKAEASAKKKAEGLAKQAASKTSVTLATGGGTP